MSDGEGQKKTGNGCLMALLIAGGLVVIAFGSCVVCVNSAWRSDDMKGARRAFQSMKDTVAIMQEASTGPDAQALVTAGCKSAFVIDQDRLRDAWAAAADAGVRSSTPPPDDGVSLRATCSAPAPDKSCTAMAQLLLAAHPLPAGKKLAMTILDGDGGADAGPALVERAPRCSATFDEHGKQIVEQLAAPALAASSEIGVDVVEAKGVARELALRVVRNSLPMARACHELALKDGEAGGALTLEWTLAAGGAVTAARAKASDTTDARIDECMLKLARGMAFPTNKPGAVVASYTFRSHRP